MPMSDHLRMSSILQQEDQFALFFLVGCCYNLLDEFYGSSVAVIVAPLCVLLLVVAARSAWLRHDPPPFRKQSTWIRKISPSSMLVFLMRTIYFASLIQILVFGHLKTINIMILNTLIFALGCGVRLSSVMDRVSHPPLGGDPVSRSISNTSSPSKKPQAPTTSGVPSTLPSCKDGASQSVVDIVPNPPLSVQDTLQKKGWMSWILSQDSKKTAEAETWILDSGASFNMTGNRELLSDFEPLNSSHRGVTSAWQNLPILGVGSTRSDRITLPKVFYIPGLSRNIISVPSLSEHSFSVAFAWHDCVIYTEKGDIIGRGTHNGEGLYVLDYLHLPWKSSSTSRIPTGNDGLSSQSKAQQAAGHIREPGICDPAPSQVCSNNVDLSNKRCTVAFPAVQSTGAEPRFIVDSGAGKHMTGFPGLENLVTWPPRDDNCVVGISGCPMPVTGVGSVKTHGISLHSVSQVPGLDRLLVSVSQLTMEYPVQVIFNNKCCRIEHENGEAVGYGKIVGGLYSLELLCLPPPRGDISFR